MLEDIATFAAAGVRGVVFGVLASDGSVDKIKTMRLADEAKTYNLEGVYPSHSMRCVEFEVTNFRNTLVCFHRAFDMVNDADKGMEPGLL